MNWRWRALGVLAQGSAVALACGQLVDEAGPAAVNAGDSPASAVADTVREASVDNGQTGSTDEAECNADDHEWCLRVDLDDWRLPAGRAELVGAACRAFSTLYPVCECRMRRSLPRGEDRPWDEWSDGPEEVVEHVGDGGCVTGRTPSSCLYCGDEFPGCNLADATSCDAVCADLAERYDADMRKTFSAERRLARCGETGTCNYVTEIDGVCYARDPRQKNLPSFDCSLSDAQILEHRDERYASDCPGRPVAECETASDCPRGLACDQGVCVGCGWTCGDDEGRVIPCPGAPACGEGELCVLNACLPAANIDCGFFTDCAEEEDCVLSGMDLTGGRGTAATRTLCVPYSDLNPALP